MNTLNFRKLVFRGPHYVGDSFLNDIIGAKQAGWHSIWYNHRKRIADNESVASDFVVENEEELIHLLKEIISKKND
ncbi:TPA: HAD family hydrolase [Streptococcus suis]|nr:HAD family hydrolase [Streptococcus suis]